MSDFDTDAIVIGSGFGGATAALRLAEAGRRVMVLERGARWAPRDFVRDSTEARRIFWRHPDKPDWRGLYEFAVFGDMAAVVGSGVGGGSLVWANVLARPGEAVFRQGRWPAAINRASLDPLYDRVIAALQAAPVPEFLDLPKRNRFRAAAAHAGQAVYDPPQAVAWSNPSGEGRQACVLCASCELGCTYGAKHTLDFTHLARAEQLGGRVLPNAMVMRIEPRASGGYDVVWRDTLNDTVSVLCAPQVVLAAGTLGTLELLFRSREAEGGLAALGERLGKGISVNGDFFGTVAGIPGELLGDHGPDVTSILTTDEGPSPFTIVAPAFNAEAMRFIAALGQPATGPLRLGESAWRALASAVPALYASGLVRSLAGLPDFARASTGQVTNVFAIGQDNAGGVASFRHGQLDVAWDFAAENQPLIDAMEAMLRRLADGYGGRYAPLATWELFRKPVSVHPLGGCPMGSADDGSVVDERGQVHRHPGLFVADGAIVQSSLGVHPALTIAALAEHVAQHMLKG